MEGSFLEEECKDVGPLRTLQKLASLLVLPEPAGGRSL